MQSIQQFNQQPDASDVDNQEYEPFIAERENGDMFVRLINPGLIEVLRKYLQAESLYERNPRIPVHELFLILPDIKKASENDNNFDSDTEENSKRSVRGRRGRGGFTGFGQNITPSGPGQIPGHPYNKEYLKSLVDLIEVEYEHRVCEIKEMIDNNVISFNNLFYLFTKDQHVYALSKESVIGAKVVKATYHRHLFGAYMSITVQIIDSDGASFNYGIKTFTIRSWEGVRDIEELPIIPLSEENSIRNKLVARGRKFAKYAIGPHYLHCTGNMFRSTWFGITTFKSEGRVMVDCVSFAKINPSYNMETAKKSNTNSFGGFGFGGFGGLQSNNDKRSIKDEELFMCVPYLYGFSFTAKKWGQVFIDELEEISFDDSAFEQLVMDPIKKELISSLVKSKHKGVDFISGKGGGCIFLLHGPPGVGKTLTAEAISEYLHRPLYNVSVGELGTSAIDLEKKLSEILEVASIWNAVILIDEADIFLERRSEHDIKRNALVSVFLRLLEYHQGILFLTTNRVKCFDAAFQSRISVALKYNDLDANAREQIWYTFLNRVEGKNKSQVDVDRLKERSINGREIKTVVRLAKALTTKNDPDALITTQQLETILDISKSFVDELAENNLENQKSTNLEKQDLNENDIDRQINELKMQLEKLEARKKEGIVNN